jgi:hypothetical protein
MPSSLRVTPAAGLKWASPQYGCVWRESVIHQGYPRHVDPHTKCMGDHIGSPLWTIPNSRPTRPSTCYSAKAIQCGPPYTLYEGPQWVSSCAERPKFEGVRGGLHLVSGHHEHHERSVDEAPAPGTAAGLLRNHSVRTFHKGDPMWSPIHFA